MRERFARLLRPIAAVGVVIIAVLAAGALLGALGEANLQPGPTDAAPDGADSTTVLELQQSLPSGSDETAVVLLTDDDGLDTATLRTLEGLLREITGGEPRVVPSDDGTAAVATLPVDAAGATAIGDEVERLRNALREGVPDGVTAQVTGPAAIQADLADVFEGADLRLLLTTAGIVAVLLLVTYRSPVLWLVPLAVVGVADRVAAVLATRTLEVTGVAWDESTVGILSVLVFGAGTDYALLLISRYRDELKQHEDRYAAMRRAWTATAEAVLTSSVTVVAALLTLLLSVLPTTRGLGLACAVGIVVAAFAALVVLPCALVLCGRWVFWPLVPHVGQPTLAESRSFWSRVGGLVDRRPSPAALGSVLLLGVLAFGLTQVQTGLREADQFLDQPESISAAERLAESFPAGSSDPTVLLTRADPDRVTTLAGQVPGVDSTRPGPQDDGLARIDVVLADPAGSEAATATVERLRESLADVPDTYVGGTEAEQLDAANAAARDRRVIIPLILAVVIVALIGLLRSLVAPLILVATVVATYLASLGASWWIFTQVLGFDRLDVGVPLLAFLFLVALGVDYNIFLVTRAAEESREHGTRQGMLRALATTGGVITSAGILLAAVFAVLGVLPLVVLAQLGTVICIGVLLDTLLVRTVLVPAIALLLGDRFWWPRRLSS
ncbi:MMPL family transporter [Nocardioides bigeumensis]|uniref:MMPL family transporter n=1 Tax=Nocardioides bigeumensis TaxID=433657 RepID=A0ABN2XV74_9ACTN